MNLDIILILISVLMSIYGSYNYIYDTIKGTTRPNRVSQGLWAVAPLIGVGAAISSGADWMTTVRTFMAGFGPLIIFIASFTNKTGYWKTTMSGYLCGIFSVIALILWLIVDLPIYAVVFAVLADGFAAIPTIRKSWTNPESETGLAYVISFFSTIIILPTIKVLDIQSTSFQIYLLVVNIIIIFSIYRKRIFS